MCIIIIILFYKNTVVVIVFDRITLMPVFTRKKLLQHFLGNAITVNMYSRWTFVASTLTFIRFKRLILASPK